jgi:FtsP/CotA-like multicopper oxidase with cupredoxin domain
MSTYPNRQLPTTLWYHDHALGVTRLNVVAGLAGFYLLRDHNDEIEDLLPRRRYEIPLAIQDRSFSPDGSFFLPTVGVNPTIHPYWVPEFIGNAIVVNGKAWPNLDVRGRQYRFRILNGSNSRFYNLNLSGVLPFTQIGSDGGYLPAPVILQEILIAPGERADVLVNFSDLAPGTKVLMRNTAPTPFPGGDTPDPDTVAQVMQFTVVASRRVNPHPLPATLNQVPKLYPNSPGRTLTLNEVMGPSGPIAVLLNGQKWSSPVTEMPRVGSTEDWELVNMTADSHPIHLHLVQFQIVSRQSLDVERYAADWVQLNGEPPLAEPTIPLCIGPYLVGARRPPASNETGWKDTVRANPGDVTRIRIRFAPQHLDTAETVPGINSYPFDPSFGPGYVWHCHILDHEDNEMMRPCRVIK